MHTFTYTPDPNNAHDTTRVVIESNAEQLEHVLAAMTAYLRAVGYQFKGELDVANEEAT